MTYTVFKLWCMRLAATASAIATLLASSSASAHNLKPHSEFTELAYAYLKAMGNCVPDVRGVEGEQVELASCTAQCKQEFLAFPADWADSCYDNLCDRLWVDNDEQCDEWGGNCTPLPPYFKQISGTKCYGISGPEKYSCAQTCLQRDLALESSESSVCPNGAAYNPQFVTAVQSGGTIAYHLVGQPVWLPTDQTERDQTADEFCRSSCYLLKYNLVGDPQCTALASVMSYGDIDQVKAEKTVNFLRSSVDYMCPNPAEIPFIWPDPATEAACATNQSVKAIKYRNEGVRVYGYRLEDGVLKKNKTSDGTLQNVPTLLSNAITTNLVAGQAADVTGLILGMNTALTDKLDDTRARMKFLPLYEDLVKDVAEYLTGAAAVIVGVLPFVYYAAYCCISWIWGDSDCFEGWVDNLEGYYDWWADKEKAIESYSLLSTDSQPNMDILGNKVDFTSLYHFMRNGQCGDDDKCGMNMTGGLGVSGYPIGYIGGGIIGQTVFDIRLEYDKSRKGTDNYQLESSDDGMPESSTLHGRWYYERLSILLVNHRPIDNMAYYWWHKWHYARGQAVDASTGRQLYGLFPLGIVLHTMQDMTLYHHANAVLQPGHSEYEGYIDNGFVVQPDFKEPGDTTPPVPPPAGWDRFRIGGPDGIFGEWDFYRKVAFYIHQMAQLKSNGVLHPRLLANYVQQTLNDANVCEVDGAAWNMALYDYNCSDAGVRQVVIPLAVAASVMVMVEATQEDDSAYIALSTPLSKFEHYPTTNSLTSSMKASLSQRSALSGAGGQSSSAIPEDPHDSWDLVYASNQPAVRDGMDAFRRKEINVGSLLTIVLREQARGRALRAGIELDEASLDKVAKAEIDKMKALTQFFKDGSLPKLTQARACADLPVASIDGLSSHDINDLQATCNGTKDSDGDGVPDLYDQCITGPSLLGGSCGAVGPDGCVYSSTAVKAVTKQAANLSAMVVPNPSYVPIDGGAPVDGATP